MVTKKFIIEVEEGVTKCNECPEGIACGGLDILHCTEYNFATIRIKELEENNESKS